jgi:hypothetical protein
VSGKGGFSKSYFLNAFFQNLYSDNLDHQVLYIPGDENPADAASRSNNVGDPISVTIRHDTIFPASFIQPCEHTEISFPSACPFK